MWPGCGPVQQQNYGYSQLHLKGIVTSHLSQKISQKSPSNLPRIHPPANEALPLLSVPP